MNFPAEIASFLEVSGFGCQVSGKKNKKPET
jgi:hypothetical protein